MTREQAIEKAKEILKECGITAPNPAALRTPIGIISDSLRKIDLDARKECLHIFGANNAGGWDCELYDTVAAAIRATMEEK